MKDRFFYPLLVLVIAVILYLAVLPGIRHSNLSPEDIVNEGYTLSGLKLQKLTAAPGTEVYFVDGQNKQPLLAVLLSNESREFAGESAGVFGTLGPNYEEGFGGHDLKITITARAGRNKPLTEFEAKYFTVGVGDSQWQSFTLSENFEDFTFTFTPKSPEEMPGNDFVGIWPGDAGESETMELKSIRIKVLR